ncbi:MAG: hypothetical protein U0836_10825 [Pirellulales bacterium]
MEELLQLAAAGGPQGLGRGKAAEELPGSGQGPIVEGLERRGVVFPRRLLQLIEQRGAGGDELALVAAEQPQLLHQGIFGRQAPPGVAVGSQGVG